MVVPKSAVVPNDSRFVVPKSSSDFVVYECDDATDDDDDDDDDDDCDDDDRDGDDADDEDEVTMSKNLFKIH